jgi:hypothetical protein
VEVVDAITDRREVGRGVTEPLVALLDDQRQGLALAVGEALGEHAQRARALDQEARGVEVTDDGVEHVVVVGLTHHVLGGERHVERRVHLGEVGHRLVDQDLPESTGLGVAALQRHHPLAAALPEVLVGFELHPRRAVEAVEVADRQRGHRGRLTQVDQVFDEHPEGRAPVAHVAARHHRIAAEAVDAREGVADDRRT